MSSGEKPLILRKIQFRVELGWHKDVYVGDITQVLDRARLRDPKAPEELLALVYDELRRVAAAKMARETQVNGFRVLRLSDSLPLRIFLPSFPPAQWLIAQEIFFSSVA